MSVLPTAPVPVHEETRRLHDAVDARTRADGQPWLHPDGPTVQQDLFHNDMVEAWQKDKAEAVLAGERCWSELPVFYARYGTHFGLQLIEAVKRLSAARAAVLTDSGMQAIALAIDALVEPGDHVVVSRDVYNKTKKHLLWLSQRMDLTLGLVDGTDPAALDAKVKPHTRMVLVETFSNPLLRALSPSAWSDAIVRLREKAPGLRLVVDDTIATPWGPTQPLLSHPGIDVIVASGTKALGGQDRSPWGYVATNDIAVANAVMDVQATRGGGLDWRAAKDVLEGLPVADARHARRSETTTRLAAFLDAHPAVEEVWHPSRPSHPDHAVYEREYQRAGGLLSLRLRDADEAAARHFCDVLASTVVWRCAPSFDGLVSKVNHHRTVSEYFTPEGELRKQNIDRLVRLAPGLEAVEDLQAALAWALDVYRQVSVEEIARRAQERRASLGL